ncbi:hypothetical protein DFJ58DRAFT_667328 [Suillus subalutaceus]|uniref:uncharacterized protein n=1 Tax=Suillus subalutaceus TaxID=48586 RepID=UPI001B86ACA0|nr:uncharacterized protein DFJ58DRAFT_667328 [Suillus subalutaceus]KAG1840058.1 hypothetical protein DFJ58DRAFT_667328 [Suillus subalutaceus]
MLKTAKLYNMSFAPVKLSQPLKKQLPAWLHLGAPPKTYKKLRDSCLQHNHGIRSVKDLMKLNGRPLNEKHHQAKGNCTCTLCIDDRLAGCKNPQKCMLAASSILTKLTPIFSPLNTPPSDDLTLTHHRREKNSRALTQRRGDIIFDPSVTEKTDLAECFRIFSDSNKTQQIPAHHLQRLRQGRGIQTPPTEIYTDGSCINNGKENARCGSGIWIRENHPNNKSIRIPGKTQSNQAGEIAAILIGLQDINPLTPVTIITDSQYAIEGLTCHLKE